MQKVYQIEGLGEVKVVKNEFSGLFSIYLNGEKLERFARISFRYMEEGEAKFILVRGSVIKGYNIVIDEKPYRFSDPLPWYCYVLCAIPLLLPLTIGNMPILAEHGFYFVGGALGGAIGGLFTGLSLGLMCMPEKWYLKVLYGMLAIAISFLACWGIGNLIVSLSH